MFKKYNERRGAVVPVSQAGQDYLNAYLELTEAEFNLLNSLDSETFLRIVGFDVCLLREKSFDYNLGYSTCRFTEKEKAITDREFVENVLDSISITLNNYFREVKYTYKNFVVESLNTNEIAITLRKMIDHAGASDALLTIIESLDYEKAKLDLEGLEANLHDLATKFVRQAYDNIQDLYGLTVE